MSLTKPIRYLFLSLFLLTPILFTSFNSELFELPKMYFVYFLATIIVALHLYNYFHGHAPIFRRSFLDIPIIIFFVSQLVATIWSVDIHTSIFGYYSRLNGGLLSLTSYLCLYWVLAVYIDEDFKQKIISVSIISGFLVASFGIMEHFGIDREQWVQDVQSRVFSTLGQPNWLAAYLCILLPFSLFRYTQSLALSGRSALRSCLYLFFTSVFYLCLLFTKSKSGIIAGVIGIFVFTICYFLYHSDTLRSRLRKFSIVLLIIALLSVFINNPLKDRLLPAKSAPVAAPALSTLNITPSEDIRKLVWQGAFDLWKRYPFFGTGVESFAYTYYWTRPAAHNLTSEWNFLYNKAHNEYINYLATTGAFGFGAYLILILVIILSLAKRLFQPDASEPAASDRILTVAVLASFLTILITNAVGFSVVVISLYFFLLPALLITPRPFIPPSGFQPSLTTKIFAFVVTILALFILKDNLYYYLADIDYARSQTLDSQNKYQSAYEAINISLYYRYTEPLYLSQKASLAAKLALVANSNRDSAGTREYADTARELTNQAISISPANLNLWKERAQIFYYLSGIDSKYFPDSIDALLKAAKLAPTDPANFYLIGKFLVAANQKQQAVPFFEKAVDLKPNYDYAAFALGQIYYDNKDYGKAKNMFETTLKIAPANTDAQDYLASISAQLRKK